MKNFFFCLSLLFPLSSVNAEEIKIVSDLWCPYACEPGERPGFMVEISTEIFKEHGISIKYDLMNWSRAIKETRSGNYTALVGASRGDVPDFIIPREPAGQLINYYFTLQSDSWFYRNESSLKNRKMAVINDYSYGTEVDSLVAKKHKSLKVISGNDALKRIIQMTESKRLHGFVENPAVLDYTLMQMKLDKYAFKVSSHNLANDPDLFVAFSPVHAKSKQYVKIMDDGIKELRKNGKLKSILQKYGLEDWKK